MQNPYVVKEQKELPAPVLLFECTLPSGRTEYWSSHRFTVASHEYEPRILEHNRFELTAIGDGLENRSTITIVLDNLDSHFSQVETNEGFKGAKLKARFAFLDVFTGELITDPIAVYAGIADSPLEINERHLTLAFRSRFEFTRSVLPAVRIQAHCPWVFPRTAGERETAVEGGSNGKYSIFYRCGYSPDVDGGCGNSGPEGPYTSCDYSRQSCQERGMFDRDSAGRETMRFGGIDYVPGSALVRSYGDRVVHSSEALNNTAKYNDFVPMVYGTGWHQPPIVFARNDGNLTHLEVLLGMGPIEGVQRVVVNDVEIPRGVSGASMTTTGWHNLCSHGYRNGAKNLDFVATGGSPEGDPYGSMAFLSVVVPNRVGDGKSLPKVQVLLDGLRLPIFGLDGVEGPTVFTRNPAWILLDVLRKLGWTSGELDLPSFSRAAAQCDQLIEMKDATGQVQVRPLFEANLILRRRRNAADILRGVRTAAGLVLRLGHDGRLELLAEGTLATQQPLKPEGSNSESPLANGWPVYEFGDGTNGTSGVLRRENGQPTVRLSCRSNAETPNRFSVEFQDALNGYQQDSVSVVDVDDTLRIGYEISAPLAALGLPHYDQALRVVKFQLLKSLRGNSYIEFESSVKALALRPGDLIAVTQVKDGLVRAPYRVTSIYPSMNYETVVIHAQRHEDEWYESLWAAGSGPNPTPRRHYRGTGIPRPLAPYGTDSHGWPTFGFEEDGVLGADGSGHVILRVRFVRPQSPPQGDVPRPTLSLTPEVAAGGGTLTGGQLLYYAVSGVLSTGQETELSFLVEAPIPESGELYSVKLRDLWFPDTCQRFRVYRGTTPSTLRRIAETTLPASEFSDAGLADGPEPPVDENYHQANFYSRREVQPPVSTTITGSNQIGSTELNMADGAMTGRVVAILAGKGAGQEAEILSNNSTTLTLAKQWGTDPDDSSVFAVVEPGWQFCGATTTDEIRFGIPNLRGSVIQIQGRSANAFDQECDARVSFVGRWTIGGMAASQLDSDIPPKPAFAVVAGAGQIEVNALSFQTLENTKSIHAATALIYFVDELNPGGTDALVNALDEGSGTANLQGEDYVQSDVLQVGHELVQVLSVLGPGQYEIQRGLLGSTASAHPDGSIVEKISRIATATAVPKEFFGSPSSAAFSWMIPIGSWRIAAIELYVTNSQGNSPTAFHGFTATEDRGIRVLPGGQYSFQVTGPLAVQSDACPAVTVSEASAVRDVTAALLNPPQVSPVVVRLRMGDETYAEVTIDAGTTQSAVVDGAALAVLPAACRLSLDILSVGTGSGNEPGSDLTVTIRL